jgi:hypothetical protein
MARGDYVEVTMRVPSAAGVEKTKVRAEGVGGSVETTMPQRNEPFVTVSELSRNDKPARTARFAASEIISIVEGHETITQPRAKQKA